MTLIYIYDNYEYTIEEFIVQYGFQKLWNELIIKEYKFWGTITLDDIIIETSDIFEEIMYEMEYDIEFKESNSINFDYNLLLDALRHFQIGE